MRQRTNRRRAVLITAAAILAATIMVGAGGPSMPAAATQLPNHWNARNCDWYKHSPRQVIQVCADIGYYDKTHYPGIWQASADITAFKEVNGVVTRDDRVNVAFNNLKVFRDGHDVTPPISYPTGPLPGYAAGSLRTPTNELSSIAGHRVKVVASLGVWDGVATELRNFIVNSLTVTAPSS